MKVFRPALLVILWASTATAEDKARAIPFIASKGDTARITVVHRKVDTSAYGSKTSEVTLTYRAEVVEETDDGFMITWHPLSLKSKGRTIDTTTDLPEIEQDIDLEFETDSAGTPIALVNHQAVRDNSIKTLEGESARLNKGVVDSVKATFARLDAQSATDVFGKYAQVISIFQGTNLEVGKPNTYESQLPSPIGGGLIKVKGSLTVTELDQAANSASLVWRQEADPESAKEAILRIARTTLQRTGKEIDETKLRAAQLDMRYVATATVGLKDGWVKSARYELSVRSNETGEDKGRSEIYDITVER